MSTTSNSIAGNSSFTKVHNLAGQIDNLSLGSGSVGQLAVGTLESGNLTLTGPGQSNIVVGYAPTSFATGAAGSIHNLLTGPSGVAATSVDNPNLLHIPANAIINRVVVTNNGTTITGTATDFNIGTKDSTASGALGNATTTNSVAGMLVATVNSGGSVGGTLAVAEQPLGSAGQTTVTSTLAGLAQGASDNLVAVTVNGGTNDAGDLRVEIHYTNA